MAAGLSVVASDFLLWKQIAEDNGCGICVGPTNPIATFEACEYFLANSETDLLMGALENRAAIE